MKSTRLSRLGTTIKKWFSTPLMRHIASGLVIVSLNNVLNHYPIPAPIAAQISNAAGALIEGKQQ